MSHPSSLSVVIVDDEAPARSRLRDLLADAAVESPHTVVGEAVNGQQAVQMISDRVAGSVDLVLTDIRMPKMDGVELARHLSRLEQPPAVVFVTAYEMYAVQAFELNAIDYLLKPVRLSRLVAALEKARLHRAAIPAQALEKIQQGARSHLSCHERGRLLLIPVSEIVYFRADLKYVVARTAEREYLLDESLTHLETEFAERFIRLHRSALAAKEAIVGFEKGSDEDAEAQWRTILLDVPERLPVSRRQWSLVKQYARVRSS